MENTNRTPSQNSGENVARCLVTAPAKDKQQTFKVCFVVKEDIGRSNIKTGKPLRIGGTVASKFYIKDPLQGCNLDEQLQNLDIKMPREKYRFPVTENQRYGWYQVQLIDTDKSDRRLHFAKHTDELIKEYLRTNEKIKE